MAAVGILGASKLQADKAGQTSTIQDQAPSEPEGTSPGPLLSEVWGESDLASFFSGGVHPESAAVLHAPANTDTEKATDSLTGRLGGLIARGNSVVAPGPAGGEAQATNALAQTGQQVSNVVKTGWKRLIRG